MEPDNETCHAGYAPSMPQAASADLDAAAPVTTVAQDADVARPNLPADEFEAITGAYEVQRLHAEAQRVADAEWI